MDFNNELDEATIKQLIKLIRGKYLSGKIFRADQHILLLMMMSERLETLGGDFLNNNLKEISDSFFDRLVSDIQFAQCRKIGKLEENRSAHPIMLTLERTEEVRKPEVSAMDKILFCSTYSRHWADFFRGMRYSL